MGIKNLNKLLNDYDCIKKYDNIIDFLKKTNKKKLIIGIDTNLYYYKYIKSSLKNPFYGFLIQIKHFYKHNIIPIYILDGKYPKEKDFLIKKRKLKNNVIIPYNDLKNFFKIMNIYYIQSFTESDKLLGSLYDRKIIDYCLTDDLDILLHKCDKLISIKKSIIYEYNIITILKNLDLNHKKFIYLCILLGCDYIKPNLNINYDDLLKIIRENEIKDYEEIFLLKYPNKKKKINYIFSIIDNIYKIFSEDLLNNNCYMKYEKKNVNDTMKLLRSLNNELINQIPYSLLLYIHKITNV